MIAFAAGCAEKMSAAGMNVIMEGRAQTLNYVRTPYRFELTLSEPLIIGKRRAAQRIAASALGSLLASPPPKPEGLEGTAEFEWEEATVKAALKAALAALSA